MEFRRVWALRGPNYWANFPVLEAELDLGPYKDQSSDEMPGFNERLKAWLPSLVEHRCSVGERGGFFQRLERGTYLAHILEHVALELQTLAGSDCGFGRARELDEEGVYRVALQYEEEALGRECLETGRRLCLAAVHDRSFDISAELKSLRSLSYDVRLGPSTGAIVRAAKSRGIPIRRLNRESLVQLGHGAQARRICTAESDRTSAIAETIAQDKELTRELLRAVSVPVPMGRPVTDAEDAWNAAVALGLPVVVKPQFGNHGRGVATNLGSRDQVLKAYAAAREESRYIMVEQFIEGLDHRLLVIGNRLIAAAIRQPAHVVGDGRSTVAQLVDDVNRDPRRSDGHSTVLSFIKLDTIGLEVLAEQGYTPDSTPPAGAMVLIRRNGNLSTGGTATDVTDRVHPEVAARAVEAARVVGLDIAGVDVVALDISRPLEEQRGGIVEVNAGPGLRMHIEPTGGRPQPVGESIVQLLFPAGCNGRIPIVGVSGHRGTAAACQWIERLLERRLRAVNGGVNGNGGLNGNGAAHGVGRVDSTGAYAGGRKLANADTSEWTRTRNLLLNPQVAAAVVEAGVSGIVREGFGADRLHVGVVTHCGPLEGRDLCGLGSDEKYVRTLRTVVDVVLPDGYAVLNADDAAVASMSEKCKGGVIFFTCQPDSPLVAEHLARGGRVVARRGGSLVFLAGGTATGWSATPLEDSAPWPAAAMKAAMNAAMKAAMNAAMNAAMPGSVVGPSVATESATALDNAAEAACEALLAACATGWALGLEPAIVREVVDETSVTAPACGALSDGRLSLANG
jgi:cyanophycin synthetase